MASLKSTGWRRDLRLWETVSMLKDERNVEELVAHAQELKRTADRLIEQSKKLMDEYEKLSGKSERKREDFSQAATRIVKETTERN